MPNRQRTQIHFQLSPVTTQYENKMEWECTKVIYQRVTDHVEVLATDILSPVTCKFETHQWHINSYMGNYQSFTTRNLFDCNATEWQCIITMMSIIYTNL
jgi:hypothetical protein